MKADPKLMELAKKARENSYSPYSKYKVGAALRTTGGHAFAGCNLENSSFPAGICAERAAIAQAISQQGKIEIAEVSIFTESSPPAMPCGICRQTLAEFAKPSLAIHSTNPAGESISITLGELLPHAFTTDSLPERL